MSGVLNLVGIQRKADFLYGLPVGMRYCREERDGGLTYGNFRPFTGSLNWQTFTDVRASLEREVYFRCNGAGLSVLYSKSPLAIYFTYGNVYVYVSTEAICITSLWYQEISIGTLRELMVIQHTSKVN